jgi:hypothetical protein
MSSEQTSGSDADNVPETADEVFEEVPEEEGESNDSPPDLKAIDGELEPPDAIEFEAGSWSYKFGEWCRYEYEDDGETQYTPFADDVWPLEVYEHVDDDEWGVRFLYRSRAGDFRYGTVAADAFATNRKARSRSAELAGFGVKVKPNQGQQLVMGLGEWYDNADDKPFVRLTDTPGWKRDREVYVNGTEVHGEETWYADEHRNVIARRSSRSGTLEEWKTLVEEEATTPGLRAALGVSLAGPLVGLLRDDPFIVHFCGDSSSGKTTAARLAASVWGSTDNMLDTWNSTVNGLENLCDVASGACLILDELGQFRGSREDLANAIYNIADTTGRTRSTRSGDLQDQRNWRLTGLSTGEVSSRQMVGSYQKGGHAVRMIDIPVRPGDVTESGEHSDRLTRRITGGARRGQYGEAGDEWVNYLLDVAPLELSNTRDEYEQCLREFDDGSPETGRILKEIALVGAALEAANAAGLVPWAREQIVGAVEWLASGAVEGRDVTDPNHRGLKVLLDTFDSDPSKFPKAGETSNREGVWGLKVQTGGSLQIWTSETHLKGSGFGQRAGVSIRSWLSWCVDQGHCEDRGRVTPPRGGRRTRWKIFDVNDLDTSV